MTEGEGTSLTGCSVDISGTQKNSPIQTTSSIKFISVENQKNIDAFNSALILRERGQKRDILRTYFRDILFGVHVMSLNVLANTLFVNAMIEWRNRFLTLPPNLDSVYLDVFFIKPYIDAVYEESVAYEKEVLCYVSDLELKILTLTTFF